jgi:uncharacterized protein YjbI with pentapeptide repeats
VAEPAHLRADCSRCFGLCCVAPAFARSADFAFAKSAGEPCRHLATAPGDFDCTVHDRLRDLGMPGCTTYDCFGAGQQVSQVTYAGRDWRAHPESSAEMFRVLGVMRALHELLWYLTQARVLNHTVSLEGELKASYDATVRLTRQTGGDLAALYVDAHRDLRLADLIGADLRGADVSGADLSTAVYLTRSQVNAARGDATTRLPGTLERPSHWRVS